MGHFGLRMTKNLRMKIKSGVGVENQDMDGINHIKLHKYPCCINIKFKLIPTNKYITHLNYSKIKIKII